MKTAQILLVSLLLAAFCGCSGISVRTDFDEKTDFTVYKTYDWIKFREESQSGLMNDPLLRKGIMDAVEEELAAKGFAPASGGAPDFFVAFHMGSRKKIDVDHYYYTYGRRGRLSGHDVSIRKYREGTLIIDIVDAAAKELVWRGHATSELNGREEAAADARASVAAIIKKFPPK